MAWLSRLQEAQVKYKAAVKQTHSSISSDDSNTRRSRRSSSNVTQNDNIIPTTTTTTTTTTRCNRPTSSPRDSRVSLTQPTGAGRRLSLRNKHRTVVPSASLNSAFWSSTSSDRRSTTSSLQSVSTFSQPPRHYRASPRSTTSSLQSVSTFSQPPRHYRASPRSTTSSLQSVSTFHHLVITERLHVPRRRSCLRQSGHLADK